MVRQCCAIWILFGAGCVFVPSGSGDPCESECLTPPCDPDPCSGDSDTSDSAVDNISSGGGTRFDGDNGNALAPPQNDGDAFVDLIVADLLLNDGSTSDFPDPLGIPLSGVDATPDPALFIFNSLAFNNRALNRQDDSRNGSQTFLERLCIAIGEPEFRCRQRYGE